MLVRAVEVKVFPSKSDTIKQKVGWDVGPVIPKAWTQSFVDPNTMDPFETNIVVCSNEYRRIPTEQVCMLVDKFSVYKS